MIVQDVITRVQRIFGDEAGVQVTPDDIMRWINECQKQLLVHNEEFNQASAVTDVVGGRSDYPFPVDCSTLDSVLHGGYRLKYIAWNEYNAKLEGSQATPGYPSGTPQLYTTWASTIKLFPTPDKDITSGLKIFYIKFPTPVATFTDTLSIPQGYEKAVVDYCLQQAYEMDEDVEKSQLKASQYDDNLKRLNGRESRTEEFYPTITVMPGDDSMYGMYNPYGGY